MGESGSTLTGLVQGRRWPIRRRLAQQQDTAEDIAALDIAEEDARDEQLPPPEPVLMADPPERRGAAALRLAGLGLALVLTLAIGLVRIFVTGPPSVADLRAQAGVDEWTELRVGVKDDQPGIGYRNEDGVWTGFDIDMAYMIAEDLGFRPDDVRFFAIESEDRARMQGVDTEDRRVPVQLVIASYSINADRRKMPGVLFSEPYLYTEQSVVTLKGHERVSSWQDLARKKVCTIASSTSVTAPENVNAVVLRKNRISDCFTKLDAREVEAVTTDAAILAGYKNLHRDRYEHWDLGLENTEAYGVNVGENPALRELVNLTLYQSYLDPRDDRWEEAYRENLQSLVSANEATPIAVAQQPLARRPDVRALAWERALP